MTQLDTDRSRTAQNAGRVPPSAIEAEESLIGAMLLSAEAVERGLRDRAGRRFLSSAARTDLRRHHMALTHAAEPVDYVTVQAKLQERGAVAIELAVLSSLQLNTPSAANAQHYAEIVRDKAQQRRLIAVGGEIVDDSYVATDDVVGLIDEAERKINQIGDNRRIDSVSPCSACCSPRLTSSKSVVRRADSSMASKTGYRSLDLILQGLQPSSMTIIGARPGTG